VRTGQSELATAKTATQVIRYHFTKADRVSNRLFATHRTSGLETAADAIRRSMYPPRRIRSNKKVEMLKNRPHPESSIFKALGGPADVPDTD
jgi:hypothetical protein